MNPTGLQIRDLTVSFPTEEGPALAADHVSLDVRGGETLGLVGESGCGKSVTALSILRLLPSPPARIESGHVLFGGQDLLALPIQALRSIRGQSISMIFQEPMTALSPLHRIGFQLIETLRFHRTIRKRDAEQLAVEGLARVGLPDPRDCLQAWPHQLSGGMRQRVMIAMALLLEPRVLIADEPTTALDVTVQAQILDLLRELRGRDSSILLITHDMGVIHEMCDRVAVMYASEIVEVGSRREIFENPLHPYTEALIGSILPLSKKKDRLTTIPGMVPPASRYPAGCRFRERCPFAAEKCKTTPPLFQLGDRTSRCFFAENRAQRSRP